jgi:hypothetical protein
MIPPRLGFPPPAAGMLSPLRDGSRSKRRCDGPSEGGGFVRLTCGLGLVAGVGTMSRNGPKPLGRPCKGI